MKIFILNDDDVALMEKWLEAFNERINAFSGCNPIMQRAMTFLRNHQIAKEKKRREAKENYWKLKYDEKVESLHHTMKEKEYFRGTYETLILAFDVYDDEESIEIFKRIRDSIRLRNKLS